MSKEKFEYPKKLTATNDVTGALIKSKGTNQEEYNNGWDAIWGKKASPCTICEGRWFTSEWVEGICHSHPCPNCYPTS